MQSNKKCVPLNNLTIQQGVVPLRITVPGQLKENCYIFYNLINAIINVQSNPYFV